jgi:UDP-N-acetylmuramate dehydrogenase
MPEVHSNHPLRNLNSFHLDVHAQKYCECRSIADIQELISSGELHQDSLLILGEGSNLLFSGNVKGLVLRPLLLGREIIREDRDHVWIRAGAGENWDEFVEWCTLWGYGGLQNLALIPGSVGSGPIQNIGAYCVEVESYIE